MYFYALLYRPDPNLNDFELNVFFLGPKCVQFEALLYFTYFIYGAPVLGITLRPLPRVSPPLMKQYFDSVCFGDPTLTKILRFLLQAAPYCTSCKSSWVIYNLSNILLIPELDSHRIDTNLYYISNGGIIITKLICCNASTNILLLVSTSL